MLNNHNKIDIDVLLQSPSSERVMMTQQSQNSNNAPSPPNTEAVKEHSKSNEKEVIVLHDDEDEDLDHTANNKASDIQNKHRDIEIDISSKLQLLEKVIIGCKSAIYSDTVPKTPRDLHARTMYMLIQEKYSSNFSQEVQTAKFVRSNCKSSHILTHLMICKH